MRKDGMITSITLGKDPSQAMALIQGAGHKRQFEQMFDKPISKDIEGPPTDAL